MGDKAMRSRKQSKQKPIPAYVQKLIDLFEAQSAEYWHQIRHFHNRIDGLANRFEEVIAAINGMPDKKFPRRKRK
jgi:hypothetical protein